MSDFLFCLSRMLQFSYEPQRGGQPGQIKRDSPMADDAARYQASVPVFQMEKGYPDFSGPLERYGWYQPPTLSGL